jgi:selenocysteine-specific translation elongation factor
MTVLNVAFVGTQDYAKSIAKLNDTRDIESYVYKVVEDGETKIISLLRPLRHPERLRPLLSVLNVARCGIVEIEKVDATIGEILVAFGCSGIEHGHIIIRPAEGEWVDPDQIRVIQQQAGLTSWTLHSAPPNEHEMRKLLFDLLDSLDNQSKAPLVIPVDQHFNVKGVGLVAIGYVQSGIVNKYDKLLALPTSEIGTARSLQVMDDDVDAAIAGDRVGVAMRDMRQEALERGSLLVKPDEEEAHRATMERHEKSRIQLTEAPFQQKAISVGDVIHAAVDLQFVVGRVEAIESHTLDISWDQTLFLRSENQPRVLINQLDLKMRVIGFSENLSPID